MNISDHEKYRLDLIEDRNSWNLLLEKLNTSCTYMMWSWGDYKKNYGWDVKRLMIVDMASGRAIACCQLQSKRIGFIYIHLIQGGIHIIEGTEIKNIYDNAIKELHKYINGISALLWILFINYQSHNFDEADTAMMKYGFMPILTTKMFTYLLPYENVNEDRSSLSKNWRHNLNRAKNNKNLKICWATTYEDRVKALKCLSEMYNELINRKNFTLAIDLNYALELIANDKKMLIAQAKLNDDIVAVRVASVCNDHMLDFIAASNEGAKKCYANYLLMWEMIMVMKNYNKSFFDTGGINPASNTGVFNFKKGLNGNLALNGPLWCLGSNFIVQWITRKLIT